MQPCRDAASEALAPSSLGIRNGLLPGKLSATYHRRPPDKGFVNRKAPNMVRGLLWLYTGAAVCYDGFERSRQKVR